MGSQDKPFQELYIKLLKYALSIYMYNCIVNTVKVLVHPNTDFKYQLAEINNQLQLPVACSI